MKVQEGQHPTDPESTLSGYGCIWIALPEETVGKPLQGALAQWLDWRLQGILSKPLANQGFGAGATVFLPMTRPAGFRYLAIEPSTAPDWDLFQKNCEGQKWERVLFICGSEQMSNAAKSECARRTAGAYPSQVDILVDSGPL